jgi:hypothetical protein
MEANLEAYLAKRGIEYEKVTKIRKISNIDKVFHYYILEKSVVFDTNFDFMDSFTYNKNSLLRIDDNINHALNELNKNNIKYKEVLLVKKNCLRFEILCEIENIIFCPEYFDYEDIIKEYEFRKFIKYNTTFEQCKFDDVVTVSTDKLGDIIIFNSYSNIHLIRWRKGENNKNDIVFYQFQTFMNWLAENMPEYLQNHDIKIALKN